MSRRVEFLVIRYPTFVDLLRKPGRGGQFLPLTPITIYKYNSSSVEQYLHSFSIQQTYFELYSLRDDMLALSLLSDLHLVPHLKIRSKHVKK